MSDADQLEVLRHLAMVEAETDPFQAERLLLAVLRPLLEAEGYTLEHTGGPGDLGIDFLATGTDGERGLPSRIGVQYKHLRRPLSTDAVQQVIGASITNDLERM